jgi:hypothetical protein
MIQTKSGGKRKVMAKWPILAFLIYVTRILTLKKEVE